MCLSSAGTAYAKQLMMVAWSLAQPMVVMYNNDACKPLVQQAIVRLAGKLDKDPAAFEQEFMEIMTKIYNNNDVNRVSAPLWHRGSAV